MLYTLDSVNKTSPQITPTFATSLIASTVYAATGKGDHVDNTPRHTRTDTVLRKGPSSATDDASLAQSTQLLAFFHYTWIARRESSALANAKLNMFEHNETSQEPIPSSVAKQTSRPANCTSHSSDDDDEASQAKPSLIAPSTRTDRSMSLLPALESPRRQSRTLG